MRVHSTNYALKKLVSFLRNTELDRRKTRKNFIHSGLCMSLCSHIFGTLNVILSVP